MTHIDLDKLEALADAATPGPWTIDPQNQWDDGTNLPEQVDLRVNGSRWSKVVDAVHVSDADAAFIAAANPATIKSLIASAREAAAEIEEARALIAESIGLVTEGYDDTGRFVKKGRAFLARAAQMDGEG